jgi:RHS repeat-associated protein
MKLKIRLAFKSLSILLASHLAPLELGQLTAGVAPALVGLGGLAIAGANESRGASPPATPEPVEPANPPAALHFSAEPTDAEIFNARVFDEPLVPSDGRPRADENRALAGALTGYAQRSTYDDCSSLAHFADQFPQSRWTASLLLHLGVEYYNYGYFSKALDAWQRAWAQFQASDYPPAKPQADRALGELARMYARIGRAAELSALLDSTKGRDLGGPASQLVHSSTEALWIMMNKPDYAFGCGPSALDRILLHFAPSKAGSPVLLDCKSGTNGFALNQVADISRKLRMNYQMAYRERGAPLIVPSVVHWKIDHYAALIERRNDRILVQDYTFAASLWVSEQALGEETSGYFLVPQGTLPAGWRPVAEAEGRTVWGRGQTAGRDPNATCPCLDKSCGGSSCTTCKPCIEGMATYTMHALLTSLTLEDTPVRFNSPVGSQVGFTATYNQNEANQPASFYYSNLGPLWDYSWLSYITDNPFSPGADVSLYMDGGGTLPFSNFNPGTQSYSTEAMSQTVLVLLTNATYELRFPDGSRREYGQSDGSAGSTRRIFMTQMIDPSGNAVQFKYDSQLRITNVVNAIGQAMTLLYTNTAFLFQITSVVDPFGRAAQLLYNTNGLLIQITDVMGLTSQFTYGSNQFVTALTTPYGTTTFATGTTNGGSYLMATDPLGGTELVEYSQALPVPHALPASEVPHGLSTFNLFIDSRDSFYWDKKAYAEGAWDWTKAHLYHWLHQSPAGQLSARILESEKDPLEGRIWYNYPGQSTNFGAPYYLDAAYTGASDEPTVVARVLDDGTTQLHSYLYNAFGNVTNSTDPLGRNFTFVYATNNIDLLQVFMTHNGKRESITSVAYNPQHLPVSLTDPSGQTTTNTYNPRGQLLTLTDAKNQTTTFSYDTNGFVLAIQGPLAGPNDTVSLTYDTYNRVRTYTDTEGYTVTFSYDAFDRPILMSYPDGTTEQLVYDRLDLVTIEDRLGRWTTNTYNANRQLVSTLDPLGRLTRFEWCTCGLLEAIIDPIGRKTSFIYDVQGRLTAKQYPDGSVETQTYENSSGRPSVNTDAAGHRTIVEYNADDTVKRIAYLGGTNPTPAVTFTYDPDYKRVATMQDGIGTTIYTYNPITPVPALGAGRLQSVSGPLPNSMVTYQYDQLGRVVNSAINGVGQSAVYDAFGRPTVKTNSLGVFHYSYLNATRLLTSMAYPNGQTNLYSYYGIAGDQRLLQIQNLHPNGSLLSSFGYGYNAVGEITAWTNQWDTLPIRVWLPSYDAVDQLTNVASLGGPPSATNYAYAYDLAQNRTVAETNAVRDRFQYNPLNQLASETASPVNSVTYEWDAANRLVAINQGTHRTQFSYDGFGRRARIVEKENGAIVADNYFLWCGNSLCEERDSTGAVVVRRYFPQGESVVGAGATSLFYTRDHLGSIRETLDAGGSLQARYDYDVYGRQTILAETSPASFGFTGHFQHRPSGLYLALLRAYDPRLGRWLSRDPLGEAAGLNLYAYVGNDPINSMDLLGDKDNVQKAMEFVQNLSAGFSDAATFGFTKWARGKIWGACDPTAYGSWTYFGGEVLGIYASGKAVSMAGARLIKGAQVAAEAGAVSEAGAVTRSTYYLAEAEQSAFAGIENVGARMIPRGLQVTGELAQGGVSGVALANAGVRSTEAALEVARRYNTAWRVFMGWWRAGGRCASFATKMKILDQLRDLYGLVNFP